MNSKTSAYIAIIAGIIFVGLAIFYWITPAGSLPSFFPGYLLGSTAIHIKHGLASFILALALFVYAWFASAKKVS